MVWGAITANHKSALVVVDENLNAVQYRDDILGPAAVPFGLAAIGPGFLFQIDNAQPHRAHIIQDFHRAHIEYTHMEWSAHSPDLNPIEHAWDMLGRGIA